MGNYVSVGRTPGHACVRSSPTNEEDTIADDQPLWGHPEVAAHLDISVQAARSRKSRGSLPVPDGTTVPDRPHWKPATLTDRKPVGRGFRADLYGTRQNDSTTFG
ncbi:MarR family transcriptional regulator [Streptomyces sp. NPDC006197]|uniref:MarR family transcriptional regulator n=1 Tax=Streptomyces sp. NPDC006197 TaxID=3156685 RepID=UPI0033BAEE38